MGTTAQKLQAILDSKAAIKTAISNKSGTITDSTPLDDYATSINSIIDGLKVLNGTLESLDNNNVTRLPAYIFRHDLNLININTPNCVNFTLDDNSYSCVCDGCSNLTSVKLGTLQADIPAKSFSNCTSLISFIYDVDNSISTTFTIRGQAFRGCSSLENIDLKIGELGELYAYGLQSCYALKTVNLHNCSNIGAWSFSTDTALESITIERTGTICSLNNVNAFNGITGPVTIYVPSDLISSYQSATNWSTLYNNNVVNFVAIS